MDLNITLPESWKPFIDAEVSAGRHSSVEEYIQMLLTEVKLRKARVKVEALLEEGVKSGPAQEWTKNDWDDIRHGIEEELGGRNGNSPGPRKSIAMSRPKRT
jgi:antitoxin ParD1/3/4